MSGLPVVQSVCRDISSLCVFELEWLWLEWITAWNWQNVATCFLFWHSPFYVTSHSPWIGLIGHCVTFGGGFILTTFQSREQVNTFFYSISFFSAHPPFFLNKFSVAKHALRLDTSPCSSIRVLDRLIKLRGATGFSLVCCDCSGLIIIYYQRSLATESKVIRHGVLADSSHHAPSVTGEGGAATLGQLAWREMLGSNGQLNIAERPGACWSIR